MVGNGVKAMRRVHEKEGELRGGEGRRKKEEGRRGKEGRKKKT
jgi:hypothetical protein